MDDGVGRAGLWLGAIASGLWLVVAAMLYAGRGGGATIGAAMLMHLTIALSVTAAVVLVASWALARRSQLRQPAYTVGAVLSASSAPLLVAVLALGPSDSLPDTGMTALLVGGVLALIASVSLFAVPPRGRTPRI